MLCGLPYVEGVGMPLVTGVAADQSLVVEIGLELYRMRYEAAVPTVPSLPGALQLKFTEPLIVMLVVAARFAMADGGVASGPLPVILIASTSMNIPEGPPCLKVTV